MAEAVVDHGRRHIGGVRQPVAMVMAEASVVQRMPLTSVVKALIGHSCIAEGFAH